MCSYFELVPASWRIKSLSVSERGNALRRRAALIFSNFISMNAFIPPSPSLVALSSFRISLSSHPESRTRLPPSSTCVSRRRRRRTTITASLPDFSATKRVRSLAVMVSGSGRSLQNLIDKISDGTLTNCSIDLVICSKASASAVDRAAERNIPTVVLQLKDFNDTQAFSDAISNQFDTINPHLIVMAGWMHFYQIPDRYIGKVINIHPSLIPAFCGKGYYGSRVHRAVVSLFYSCS